MIIHRPALTLAACAVMISHMALADPLSKTLEVPKEKTAGFDIPHADQGGELKLILQPPKDQKIVDPEIVEQDTSDDIASRPDDLMWKRQKSEETNGNAVFRIGGVFSSRHWVHIRGKIGGGGGSGGGDGGGDPAFDAYAPALDIDVADKRDPVGGVDPEETEELCAAVIRPNADDDDKNGEPDGAQTGAVTGEDDLVKIIVSRKYELTDVKLTIESGSAHTKLYASANRTQPITIPSDGYTITETTKELWVECSEASTYQAIKLKVTGKAKIGETTDLIALLPVEFQVKRPQNGKGEWIGGSGKSVDNLLSVWPSHVGGKDWIQVKIVLPGQSGDDLPAQYIKWTVEGSTTPIPDNTLKSPELRWPGQTGIKKITIDFPKVGLREFLYVDLPDVGSVSEQNLIDALKLSGMSGIGIVARIAAHSVTAEAWSLAAFGPGIKLSHRNALKHAAWMAFCASDIYVGPDMAETFGVAHEFTDKEANNSASESTMDLFNNAVGASMDYREIGVNPDQLIYSELLKKLKNGELRIWDGDGIEHADDSLDLIIKSDGQRLYPSEERY